MGHGNQGRSRVCFFGDTVLHTHNARCKAGDFLVRVQGQTLTRIFWEGASLFIVLMLCGVLLLALFLNHRCSGG